MATSILLKGGTVILHGDDDSLSTVRGDVLIKGNAISKIEPSIATPPGCDVIDCTDKVISPGFVDTHRHMWETALKGLCEDLTCVSYFAQMFTSSSVFTPEDVFWGSLAGCMEAIDAGTTSVLDFAHMNWTPEHGKRALAGTITSGIRSTFAYAPTVMPDVAPEDLLPNWFMPNLELLAKSKHISPKDSRVTMGFGFDFYFLPKEFVLDIFSRVRSLGIRTVTSHWARFPGNKDNNLPSLLDSYGILDDRIVLSHVGGATSEDAEIIRRAGAFVSASPSVETTMGLGPPLSFRDDFPGLDSVCSLGVDSHHATSSSMANEMRAALLLARSADIAKNLAEGKVPDKVCRTAHDAYIMGTIRGARALGMEGQVGSIKVGKKADIVIFDTMSTSMAGAAQHDPVTAIVMHSSIGDVETVIVDGVVRKRNGKLLPVSAVTWDECKGDFIEAEGTLEWREIVPHVLDTQRRFVNKLPEHDMGALKTFTRNLYSIP